MNPLRLERVPGDAEGAKHWNEHVLGARLEHEQKRRVFWFKAQYGYLPT